MPNLPIQEYGVAIVAVIALVWIVRAFLAHLKDKDDKFVKIVGNHIDHSTQTMTELKDVIRELKEVIKDRHV